MKSWIFFFIFFTLSDNGFSSDFIKSMIVNKNEFRSYAAKDVKEHTILRKKGDYATASLFDHDGSIDWAKKFDIVELGGIDDPKITYALLKEKGLLDIKHHLAYDWLPAFYYYTSGENRKFINWLYKNRSYATLNPKGPFLHCKENHYDWCEDYYYNLGNTDVMNGKINSLENNMKTKGFNGLFFDWASGSYILENEYKKILSTFKKLNPKKDYFTLIGDFYKKLKKAGIFVVTNQAFRKDKYLLPYVTYDMTESYITTDQSNNKKIQIEGKGWVNKIQTTEYYPINQKSKSLQDTLEYLDLLAGYAKKYKKDGFKNFIYLNYLGPDYELMYKNSALYRIKKPKNGIYFSYAMAKLTNSFVYAEVSYDRTLERDDVYFYDLGLPLGKNYQKLDAIKGYVRFYTNGFVLASSAYKKDIDLKISSSFLPKNKEIYDAYEGVWIKSKMKSVILELKFDKDIFTKAYLPMGRVYLYGHLRD